MTRTLILILTAVPALLIGCDEILDITNSTVRGGTLLGFRRCIERNQNTGLSSDSLETQCRARYSRPITIQYEAQSGYKTPWGGIAISFSGWIENKSKNKIITSLEIQVSHDDNVNSSGKQIIEFLNVEGLWIEPNKRGTFDIYDLKFKPQYDRLKKDDKFLYSWDIAKIEGLAITLR